MRLGIDGNPGSTRALVLDQARGLAVLAMVVYHFAWDLSHFGLVATDVGSAPGWKLFAQCIAASFLVIAGVGLALGAERMFTWWPFLRRLAVISGAAALVTLATWFAFPGSYIFFGILHCIAVSSVIALPFLTLPPWFSGVAGLGFLALPLLVSSPVFEVPALIWLGLGEVPPRSNDYVPIFPWTGFLLLGLATGKAFSRTIVGLAAMPFAWLARPGRWSLPIYLIHQPLLFGGFLLAGQAGLIEDSRKAQGFVRACAVECQVAGAPPSVCAQACACTAERLKSLPLWRNLLADSLSQPERARAEDVGRACYRETLMSRPTAGKP